MQFPQLENIHIFLQRIELKTLLLLPWNCKGTPIFGVSCKGFNQFSKLFQKRIINATEENRITLQDLTFNNHMQYKTKPLIGHLDAIPHWKISLLMKMLKYTQGSSRPQQMGPE